MHHRTCIIARKTRKTAFERVFRAMMRHASVRMSAMSSRGMRVRTTVTVRDVVSDDVQRFTGNRPERVDVDVAQLVSGSAKESTSTTTRRKPVRRRAGFIDLPPVGDSVDEVEAIGS